MDTQTRVRIVDKDHPHFSESGYLTGSIITVLGQRMAEMKIDHCRHGTDGCYIARGQIEIERRAAGDEVKRRSPDPKGRPGRRH